MARRWHPDAKLETLADTAEFIAPSASTAADPGALRRLRTGEFDHAVAGYRRFDANLEHCMQSCSDAKESHHRAEVYGRLLVKMSCQRYRPILWNWTSTAVCNHNMLNQLHIST